MPGITLRLLVRGAAIASALAITSCPSEFALDPEPPAEQTICPRLRLPRVLRDADDCAIWVHPTRPEHTIVIGNDKSGRRKGLYVYDLEGRILQFVPMEKPSNLDVEYGLRLGGRSVDVCAVVEKWRNRLRVFAIDPATRQLADLTAPGGLPTHIDSNTYGLALYKRRSDGALFAFASSRTRGEIVQLRLADDGAGKVQGSLVRRLRCSPGIVEGMVADDELGLLYAAVETRAVLKFRADPDAGNTPIAQFALGDGIQGDREGIAIYKRPDGTGYILLSSQGNSTLKVYAREGGNRFIKTIVAEGAVDTDGIDVTPCPAGPLFPRGFLVCHNSPGRNFVLYAWEDIAGDDLAVCTAYDPRAGGRRAPPSP